MFINENVSKIMLNVKFPLTYDVFQLDANKI